MVMSKIKLAHELIPEHKKLNEKEAEEILKKYKIVKTQMPKISVADPALKGLDVKKGDIIEIKRKSETAGTALYYRVVY